MFRNMNVLNIEKICTRFWNKALDIFGTNGFGGKQLETLGDGAVAVREKEMSYFSKTIEENRSCFDCYCSEESRGGERHQVVLDLRSLRAIRLLVANHSNRQKFDTC